MPTIIPRRQDAHPRAGTPTRLRKITTTGKRNAMPKPSSVRVTKDR
jgi:hypothetical protein